MNIFKGLERYREESIIKRLLPYGCDIMTAKYILYALHYDLCFINAALLDDMTETGLYMCLDRLSFNIHELKDYEKEVLIKYCLAMIPESSSSL